MECCGYGYYKEDKQDRLKYSTSAPNVNLLSDVNDIFKERPYLVLQSNKSSFCV